MSFSEHLSKLRFTHGPWKVEKTYITHNSPTRFWETGVSGGGVRVSLGIGATEEEAEANAHIIAAAPVMYRKLYELRDAHMCVCKLNKIVAPLGAGVDCTRCELDALLAEAEGQTP